MKNIIVSFFSSPEEIGIREKESEKKLAYNKVYIFPFHSECHIIKKTEFVVFYLFWS